MTMQNITLSPAQRRALLRAVEPPRRTLRRRAGRIALAAVIAAALSFSAFAAVIPALHQALQNALGSFTAQSQTIAGIASEQDGIEIRPVAALSDSSMTKIYLEIQDHTGDRLTDGHEFRIELQHPQSDAPFHIGTSQRQINYDAQTNTALYELLRPDSIPAEQPTAIVTVRLFNPPSEKPEGEWTAEIPLERVAEQHFAPTATVGGYRLFDVCLSPISLTLTAENGIPDPNAPAYNATAYVNYAALPISLILRDGTVRPVTEQEENRILATDTPPADDPQQPYERGYHTKVQWLLDEPVAPEDVTAVTIGGTTVPLA